MVSTLFRVTNELSTNHGMYDQMAYTYSGKTYVKIVEVAPGRQSYNLRGQLLLTTNLIARPPQSIVLWISVQVRMRVPNPQPPIPLFDLAYLRQIHLTGFQLLFVNYLVCAI